MEMRATEQREIELEGAAYLVRRAERGAEIVFEAWERYGSDTHWCCNRRTTVGVMEYAPISHRQPSRRLSPLEWKELRRGMRDDAHRVILAAFPELNAASVRCERELLCVEAG
jgi:hypothetical protein